MKKNTSLLQTLSLALILYGIFYFMMPQRIDETEAPVKEFSTQRALQQVKNMTVKPHFVGSENHEEVALYVQGELKKMGLETSLQEGFSMTFRGTLTKPKNILARIKGSANSKALLLLAHYDSAPHSFSLGAGDDASGVATVLEGVRAFLQNKTAHKNDIIILFTDAEELGLNGAALFVTQHPWAKEVGLAINFEARGSSGPGYMLMETTKGNAKMIDGFMNAGVKFPTANSLMYSIYKMLPNDTDLTIFREEGGIQGINFAFIDNHFNYHTQQDTYEHLSPTTLAHQGTNLMPLLQYFSNADLQDLTSASDKVYFNIPFKLLSYPFSWIWLMLILSIGLFIWIIYAGIKNKRFSLSEAGRGFIPFSSSLISAGLLTFFGWKLINYIYPAYNDILHGFTYNGHAYIAAFVCLTLAICFFFYNKQKKVHQEMSQSIAPLLIWIIINALIAFKLKGAAFFIIPLFASLIMLGYYVLTGKSNAIVNTVLSIPALVILAPLIKMFPVGLGLKMLAGSAVLTVLCFSLLLPVLGSFSNKNRVASFFMILCLVFLVNAHLSSGYGNGEGKPNSLLYVYDKDDAKAYWTTYDNNMDEWTKSVLGNSPVNAAPLNQESLFSKYGSKFTYMAEAPLKQISGPSIEFLQDTVKDDRRFLKVLIKPNRKVNRYDIFADEKMGISGLKANGVKSLESKSRVFSRKDNKILSYYLAGNDPLEFELTMDKDADLNMHLWESSFDLLLDPVFNIKPRKDWMIAKPFVLNDAVVIRQKISKPVNR